jgi:8-oxo-dGTP pyrophosphatase MutT (NUDIX family)
MKSEPAVERPVARVLLFNEQDRLLLLFDPDPDWGGYWYPPGGRIEPGETPEAAARRELIEEVGLDVPDLGPVVLRCKVSFLYRGRRLEQDEWHLLGRVERPAIGPGRDGDSEAAAVGAHRWWSLTELRASSATFFPEGLVAIVEDLQRNGPPAEPRVAEPRLEP